MSLAAVAVVIMILGCGQSSKPTASAPGDSGVGQTVTVSAPATPGNVATTAPAGPLTTIPDGTHEVGTGAGQVAPGTYKSTVPANAITCYWERLSGFGGSFNEIITNGSGKPGQSVRVTINKADKGFHTEQCGEWVKA